MRKYLRSLGEDEVNCYEFGNGPNYRIRVVRKALESLKLPGNLLRHGVRRAVYVAPLADNTAAFLRGENERLRWHRRPLEAVVSIWRERWLLPRASRDASYRTFDSDSWRGITGG